MILVVGGAGYIGSHVCAALVDSGRDVRVYDNLEKGHQQAIPEGVELVVGDLRHKEKLNQALKGVTSVIQLAAYIEVAESISHPLSYYQNNVGGTLNLLEAMLEEGVKKIVFSSTAAVYGQCEETKLSESHPLSPINPYGWSKRMVEKILEDMEVAKQIQSVRLRYFNAAGGSAQRGENHQPETHLIPRLIRSAYEKNEKFSIYGVDYETDDGSCVRDYISVKDLADAHVCSLDYLDSQRSGVFNLGNGQGFSVKEVIHTVQKITGKEIEVKVASRREGDPATLVASSDKARQELAWQPQETDITSIVQGACDFYRNFPKGYDD